MEPCGPRRLTHGGGHRFDYEGGSKVRSPGEINRLLQLPMTGPWASRPSLCLPRRDLLQGQGRWRAERQRLPGGVPGRGDRNRCHR